VSAVNTGGVRVGVRVGERELDRERGRDLGGDSEDIIRCGSLKDFIEISLIQMDKIFGVLCIPVVFPDDVTVFPKRSCAASIQRIIPRVRLPDERSARSPPIAQHRVGRVPLDHGGSF